jgi:hypothetical protein
MKRIEFSHAIVTSEPTYIMLMIKDGAQIDFAEMKEIMQACEALAESKPYILLSDARVHLNITSEARSLAADKKTSPNLRANAVVVNNLAVRLTANFFVRFNQPHFKYRVFTDMRKAVDWLLKYDPASLPAQHLRQ